MNKTIRFTKGLNIRIEGEADGSLRAPISSCEDYAVKPTDFWSMRPKLLVKEGDLVKAGSPLFYDKNNDRVKVSSPVSGQVTTIVYGPKRRIEEIRLKADDQIEYIEFGSYTAEDLAKWTKEQRSLAVQELLDSGLWAFIRCRPYDVIANPERTPRDIYVSCFDTSPLAPDMDMVVHGHEEEFQAGIDAIRILTDGKLYLGLHTYSTDSKAFTECKRAELQTFEGPHPCGNISVQVHNTKPINKGEEVWYVHPQDVILMGRLFLTGKYDATKVVALAGSEVIRTGYHKIISGLSVKYLLNNNIREDGSSNAIEDITDSKVREAIRVISGNVLTGTKIDTDGYLGSFDHLISVIPEGNHYSFMGWMNLGINKFSFSRTFFSWIFKSKTYREDTNTNGGKRAFVFSGEFEKVFPMDIYPLELIKACIAKDIDRMEKLGIYEVAPEDFALCEYIDVSKTDIQQIISEGLELMRQEMSE